MTIPVIKADGVHDDLAGLNAAFKGLPFKPLSSVNYKVVDGVTEFTNNTFFVSGTIEAGIHARVIGGTFHRPSPPPHVAIQFPPLNLG